jgi:hypothetical protein
MTGLQAETVELPYRDVKTGVVFFLTGLSGRRRPGFAWWGLEIIELPRAGAVGADDHRERRQRQEDRGQERVDETRHGRDDRRHVVDEREDKIGFHDVHRAARSEDVPPDASDET